MSTLESKIWRACAGTTVEFPTVNSTVYYFPQGHINHLLSSTPYILCTISDVQFLADPNTDEVFVKLALQPIVDSTTVTLLPCIPVVDDDDDKITSFTKILSPSDANSGSGFSVPKFCAESIFPLLDLEAENPPTQNLVVTDVHGKTWEFRHIYCGTPKRHLLTTGWRNFVNSKHLIAGDSVVFMKNSSKRMFIGIRRINNGFFGVRKRTEEEKKQAELGVQNLPFEVVYYPKTRWCGWSDFVVKAVVVDLAMKVVWSSGMRVKMAVERDDLSGITWFQGTVSSVYVPDNGPWRGSPWRMLQITWDDPILLRYFEWVSPWQVELVSTIPTLHAAYPPPTKNFRVVDGSGIFPAAGMQTNHDPFSSSSFSNFLGGNSSVNNTVPSLKKTLSTELSIGISQSDDLQSDSQSSLLSLGTELSSNHICNSTRPRSVSFKLFGAVIQLEEQTVEIGSHDTTGFIGGDTSKGCNETEGNDIDNPLDGSVSYLKFLDRLDDH